MVCVCTLPFSTVAPRGVVPGHDVQDVLRAHGIHGGNQQGREVQDLDRMY